MKDYRLINISIYLKFFGLQLVKRLVSGDSLITHLDLLIQKSLRYENQKENCIKSSKEGIISTGLQLRQRLNQYLVISVVSRK